MKIRSSEELHKLLTKALEIETGYEEMAKWEGYVTVKNPKYRETIFELISESGKHATLVEALLGLVLIPKDYHPAPPRQMSFDFKGKSELEIMEILLHLEVVAYELYSDIKASVIASDMHGLILAEDQENFIKILEELIIDESHHKDLVSSHIGHVQRIR